MVRYSSRKKAARARARQTGMSYTAAARRISNGDGPAGAPAPQTRPLEPRYYRLAEVTSGRLRPGVVQKTAKAKAAGALELRSWGDFDPSGLAQADGIVAVAGARRTDWWRRVAAAGPRADCILPDPYQGRRGSDWSVPLDRALDERHAADFTGWTLRRYELDLTRIVRHEPRDVDAWAHFGNSRFDLADPATPQPLGAPPPQDRWRRSWTWTALGYYQAAVAIAELALPDPFDGFLRAGHLDNRPFFRALHGMAITFWSLGQFDAAERTLLNMLWLSPGVAHGADEILVLVRARVPWKDAE